MPIAQNSVLVGLRHFQDGAKDILNTKTFNSKQLIILIDRDLNQGLPVR